MNLFERVRHKVGSIHTHTHIPTFGDHNHGGAVTTMNQEAFRALCEIVEEELTEIKKVILVKAKEEISKSGFLSEEDMKI